MALRSGEPAGCQALKERDYRAFLLIPLALSTGWAWKISGQCSGTLHGGKAFRQTGCTRGTKPEPGASVWRGVYSVNALAALCSPLAESRTHCLKKRQRGFQLWFLSSPSMFHFCTLRKAVGEGPGRAASLHIFLSSLFVGRLLFGINT